MTDAPLATMKSYTFLFGTVCGLPNIMIARTGYTGEDGFEIYIPPDEQTSERAWQQILDAGREFGIYRKRSPCGVLTTKPETRFGSSCGRSATSRTLPMTAPLASVTRVPNNLERAKVELLTKAAYRKELRVNPLSELQPQSLIDKA